MNIKFICFIFLLFVSLSTYSTNYYISSAGSNLNAGTTSSSPFKTIENLSTINLLPGDSILFKKGDIFIGQINIKSSGTAAKPIVISSYGNETSQPIITGATSVYTWSVYPQNSKIYTTTIHQAVKQLYSNNLQLNLARYPNAPNFLVANAGMKVGNVQEYSPTTLTQASGYWVGATVKYRANNWAWEYRPITGFANGNISYKPDTRYAVADGNDFFIENKREQLDAANEWFYDSASKQLLYYPANASSLQTTNVKAVIYNNGVKIDSLGSYITISNLIFDKYAQNGVYGVARNSYIKIENCGFQNIEEIGVKFYRKANNCIVNNCFLKDINGRGISFVEAYKNTISNNTLKRIGLFQGRGISGVNGYVGIVCEIRDESRDRVLDQFDSISNNNFVHHNIIDSTGYIGVRVDGQFNTVEKNIINRAMLTMDDGGGLYCYNYVTRSSKLANNFVMNSIAQGSISNGIYVDNKVYDMTIANNTVLNIPGAAVLINAEAHDNFVLGNVLVNNAHGVSFSDWSTTPITGNKVYRNTIISNNASSVAVNINSNANRYNVAVYDSNQYVNPYTDKIFQYQWSITSTFNFTTWRGYWPASDSHSLALTNKSTPKATAGTFFLFTNKTDNQRTVDLTGCGCTDLKSTPVNQLVLPAYSSQVLIKDPAKCTGLIADPAYSVPIFGWPSGTYDAGLYADNTVFGITGIQTVSDRNRDFVIFPNPALSGSEIQVKLPINVDGKYEIKLTNVDGKTLLSDISENKNTFTLPLLSKGVYFLFIRNKNSYYEKKLLIK